MKTPWAIDIAIGTKTVNEALASRHRRESTVTEERARELEAENERLTKRVGELEKLLKVSAPHPAQKEQTAPKAESAILGKRKTYDEIPNRANGETDGDLLYESIKARLMQESPSLIKLLVTKPEIEVTVQRKILPLNEQSLKGRVARLLKQGFFSVPRSQSGIRAEMKRTGPDVNTGALYNTLEALKADGFLTRPGSEYVVAEGMVIREVEA
jgi:hypothetical protein